MCTCPPDYTGQLCEFSDCNCPAGSQCVVVEGERECSAISRDGSVTITTSNVAVINNHANTITENADDQNVSIILHSSLLSCVVVKLSNTRKLTNYRLTSSGSLLATTHDCTVHVSSSH